MSAGERTVVVGAGMAATRLVEALVARDTGPVTLVGEERHAPYNRILLSAVLEGTHSRAAIGLGLPDGVDARLGTRVAEVDRSERELVLVDGERIGYDRLVLATGSIPSLPPVRGLVGLDGTLHPSVHTLRSLDDCDRLDAAVPHARRAVVVGGGLLGLQVARALSIRGLDVEVVEGGEHLMRGQVGPRAGSVLARDLTRLGSAVYTGARLIKLTEAGLVLDNGAVLADVDLVVLAAGARPAAALARRAGLAVRRGVLVDDTLTTSDPAIHAIGDCAEHAGRTHGTVGPAWEQAEVLASRIAGADPTYDGSRFVARLRATGLDVAVLGDRDAEGEVVEVTNPVVGSHRRLMVREGRIVAATLVGDLSRIGLITQHFDRGTVLGPHEPAALLTPDRPGAPVVLPDTAEVCACAGVTAGAVRACASFDEARATTRATTGCGGCSAAVRALLSTRTSTGPTLERTHP
ncbi:FAD-dependent oxidoreductase [Nocardioides flavescens]